MIRVQRLVAPVDFSDASRPGLERAVALADDFGAELHVLHVVPEPEVSVYPPFGVAADGERIQNAIREAHEKSFARVLESLPPSRARRVTELRGGVGIAPTIVAYAEEVDADLLLLGTHGHRGFRRFLLGSVTEEVVRRAPCPVLTHPPGHPSSPARSRRILAAIDLSDQSRDVLRTAAALARGWDAELRVLHVVAPLALPGYHEAFFGTAAALDTAALEQRSREVLDKLVAEASLPSTAQVELAHGVTQHEIAAAAAHHQCDLVVVASHGLSGLEHALLGSTTARLLRRAQCPVLVLRADGKDLTSAA
ncbi:MAG TPA: universal stress protein [Thermoanaerobaculia bacterium]|nr:universal stress protein [Thermoanaerobaculia bacterium]